MLNLVSLLPFPDLGSTDPRFHDQLNSSVESFILQFRQTGYCTIVLPSGTYQPGIRKQQPANWTGIYEGELDPFHQSFVRGKLSNLVNHIFCKFAGWKKCIQFKMDSHSLRTQQFQRLS
jgi:hypothetical protein